MTSEHDNPADADVREMFSILKFIVSDRNVTEEEIRTFAHWLVVHPNVTNDGAGCLLLERMVSAFADGALTTDELTELKNQISAILLRADVTDRLRSAHSQHSGDGFTFADEWLPIVGESFYRDNFVALLGPSKADGERAKRNANLICEPENPYDHNAVAVWIEGHRVGHLSRDSALLYHQKFGKEKTVCPAHITAGWDNGGRDRGDYCVRLELRLRTHD